MSLLLHIYINKTARVSYFKCTYIYFSIHIFIGRNIYRKQWDLKKKISYVIKYQSFPMTNLLEIYALNFIRWDSWSPHHQTLYKLIRHCEDIDYNNETELILFVVRKYWSCFQSKSFHISFFKNFLMDFHFARVVFGKDIWLSYVYKRTEWWRLCSEACSSGLYDFK